MKVLRFLTLILTVNMMMAINGHWIAPYKALVIINALAVLLLIVLQFMPEKSSF